MTREKKNLFNLASLKLRSKKKHLQKCKVVSSFERGSNVTIQMITKSSPK